MAEDIPVVEMDSKKTVEGVFKDVMGDKTPTPDKNVTIPPVPEGDKKPPVQTPPEPKPGDKPPVQTPPVEPPKDGPPPIPDSLLKKPEPKKDDEFDPNAIKVEDLPEPVRPNFAKMRDKLNGVSKDLETITAERDALQAKLAASPTEDSEAVKALKEENVKLMDQLGQLNLAADPRFVAKYNQQMGPVLESLKNTLASYNVEDLDVDSAIAFCRNLSAKDRIEFLTGQLPDEIAQAGVASLLPMFSQLDTINGAMSQEMTTHAESLAKLEAEQKTENQTTLATLRAEKKQEAVQALAAEEILLKKVEGAEDWNKSVDALVAKIDATFATDDPSVHAQALASSALVPMYKTMFFAERERAEHLEEVLRSRNIAIPKVDAKAPEAPAKRHVPGSMTVDEAVGAVVKNLGA